MTDTKESIADALESLTQRIAELEAKLEDALKDRVALAMALDCGHRPPCEECRLYSPTAQQAQGQEPIDAVPLDDMGEGSHPSYGRGLFATDNCVKQFYAAPIPQQAQPESVTYTPPKIIDPDAPHPCFN